MILIPLIRVGEKALQLVPGRGYTAKQSQILAVFFHCGVSIPYPYMQGPQFPRLTIIM